MQVSVQTLSSMAFSGPGPPKSIFYLLVSALAAPGFGLVGALGTVPTDARTFFLSAAIAGLPSRRIARSRRQLADRQRVGKRNCLLLQRRGGRKRIVAPDGSELAPATKPQPDGALLKALARAWRWQRMLDDGVYTSVTEISEAEGINKSYISRILRLALLAPDTVEAVLAGKADQALMLERLERPLPASWEEQRGRLLSARTS
jgi:hypothetical protein